jgi:hypothetical protein
MDLQSLQVGDSGMNNGNAGGTASFVYIVKHAETSGMTIAANPSNPDDIPVIDYAGVAGLTNLVKVEITYESGKVRSELIGETDGKSFSHFADFHIPGTSKKNLGLAASAKNARLVIFVPEEDGVIRVVGNEMNPARFESFSGDTGDAREALKGGTYSFKSSGHSPAPILTGATIATLEGLAPSGSGA